MPDGHHEHEEGDHYRRCESEGGQELEEGSLREAATRCSMAHGKKIHVGTAVMPDYLNTHYDPYASVLNREFNSVVLEHHMKWEPLLVDGQEGVYDFRPCDKVVDWARGKGMTVKGHTLCWHIAAPKWLEELSTSRLREALYRHIQTTVGHFYGRIDSWDVVNEALSVDCSGRMQDNVYLRKLGPGYVEECFRVAHQVDPHAKLIYNDNKVEGAGLPNGRSLKSDAMYDLLKGMRDRGVPVHGAGMQAHLTASGTGQYRCPTPHAVQRNVRRLGELGLSVNISEMDVRYADLPEHVDGVKAQQQIYADILGACLSEPAFDGFTFWGFTDRYSWVHDFYKPDKPLPWDTEYRAKPVVAAIRDALLHSATSRAHDNKHDRGSLRSAEVLATPEHLWGNDWMEPEPEEGGSGGKQDGAVDAPNWNAHNHPN